MVSTRGVRYKFSEGERVLCYEPDPTKAKVLYDSKVLEVIESKDKRGRRTVEYLIHFQGWNSSWDRCVSEDFVLKDTEENRQLQRDLAEKSQLQLGAYLYRRERKKGSSGGGAGPAKRGKHGFSDDGSSSSTQPDEGETAGDTDSSMGSGSSSQEPTAPLSTHIGRAQINLPPALRDRLTFDYHLIVKRGRLSQVPASPSAAEILESFVKWFARSGAWRPTRARAGQDPPHRPDLLDVCCRLNLVREVADGLRVYFDFILEGHLLYKQEHHQFYHVCGKYLPKHEEQKLSPKSDDHKLSESLKPSTEDIEANMKSPKIPEYAHLPPDPIDLEKGEEPQPNETLATEHNNKGETKNNAVNVKNGNDKETTEHEKNKAVHDKDTVHEKDKAVHHKDKALHDKEKAVHEADKVAQDKDRAKHEKDKIVHDKDKVVQDKNKAAHERDQVVHDKDKSAHVKDKAVHDKDKAVHDKDKGVHDKDKSVHVKDKAVHDKAVHDKDKSVHVKDKAVHDKDKAVHDKDKSVHDKDKSVHVKDKAVQDKDKAVHDKDKSIHDKDKSSHDKDKAVHDKDKAVHDKDKAVHDKDKAVHNKDKAVHDKDKAVHDKDKAVHNKDKAVHDKDKAVHNKDKAANDKPSDKIDDTNHSGPNSVKPRESRCATRSGNLARRLRSHKSAVSQHDGEEPAASTSAGEPPRTLETLSSSVCSSESSISSGWLGRRAPAPAPTPQHTRTPLSLLMDKVAKWQIIPREDTEYLPCRVYGAIHLARLFVKLPDFLNAMQMPDQKLKLILKHIDMFTQYLEEHNEWFGEMYYYVPESNHRTR